MAIYARLVLRPPGDTLDDFRWPTPLAGENAMTISLRLLGRAAEPDRFERSWGNGPLFGRLQGPMALHTRKCQKERKFGLCPLSGCENTKPRRHSRTKWSRCAGARISQPHINADGKSRGAAPRDCLWRAGTFI